MSSKPTRDSFLGRQEGEHLRLTSDLCEHIRIHEHTQYVLFKPPMSGAFFFFKLFIFILHVWAFCLCICMCTVYVQCPRRSEDGARPPETGGTCGCQKVNSCSLQEQPACLTLSYLSSPELSLLHAFDLSWWLIQGNRPEGAQLQMGQGWTSLPADAGVSSLSHHPLSFLSS